MLSRPLPMPYSHRGVHLSGSVHGGVNYVSGHHVVIYVTQGLILCTTIHYYQRPHRPTKDLRRDFASIQVHLKLLVISKLTLKASHRHRIT
jgi:hypothetical protein